MIYTTRAFLLNSTRKLRNSSYVSFDSLKCLDPLLRNLSTAAAERLGFVNPNNGNPIDSHSDHTVYRNGLNSGEQYLSGSQHNSYGQNPNGFYQGGSYEERSGILNQRDQNWQSSDGNTGLVHSQTHNQESMDQIQHERSGKDSLEELDAICREGNVKTAVGIIDSWRKVGYVVDLPRLLWLAQLCGDAQALQEAKVVHQFITASVPLSDISVYNSVIEMYSGCGSMEDALTVFNSMPEKNSETWCSIIRCFAKNGEGEDSIELYSRFKEEGNIPDGEIFKEIFYACGVLGDINEGLLHLESMNKDYGIIPSMEHYVSIVRMMAEPGYLDEALRFVESMEPNVDLWETLMNLSRVHGDLEIGDRCQDIVEQLDASRLNKESKAGLVPVKPSDIANEKLKRMAKEKHHRPEMMAAGDISRPENIEFYFALKSLKEHMMEIGYVPESKLALHDVEQESKDENLFNHNEKFAFIFQFLRTPARSQIRVLKNLRVCVDCHNALKMMSKIVGRELISRDAKRFHHMKDGECTCRDYW